MQSVGSRIKTARMRGGVSQAELAMRSGVSRATINTLEKGTIKEIGINRLAKIIHAAENLPITKQKSAKKKSEHLNLSFPYDWSNPNLNDDVLISKVIERGIFEDIVRVSARFGLQRVRAAAESFITIQPIAAPGLFRMLNNVDKALGLA